MSATAALSARPSVDVHAPQVAGRFYPADPAVLAARIDAVLAAAPAGGRRAKMVVAPHAGLDYCLDIAARAFGALDAAAPIRRLVLLGPCHRWRLRGAAIHPAAVWATPLGEAPVAQSALAEIATLTGVASDARPFLGEHSLEIPLLLLQRRFPHAEIAGVLVGECEPALVDEILRRLWGGPETAVVVSSDLSHYLSAEEAEIKDARTRAAIETLNEAAIGPQEACGHASLRGAMRRARALRMRVTGLALKTSDRAGGPRDRVVGYGAFAFEYPGHARLADTDRADLIATATACLRYAAERRGATPQLDLRPDLPAALTATRGSFVTLERGGALRGCVGSPQPVRPLALDVGLNAIKAGFADPRFPPLTPEEVSQLTLKISVLSPACPLPFATEAELIAQLRPDRDGLILRAGRAAALFLPSVWRTIPSPVDFMRNLKVKMGVRADADLADMTALRFETEEFGGATAPRRT